MDLTSIAAIKKLLKKYETGPSKRLGQNFLIDKRALKKIIEAANLQSKDTVLEIGPGIGTLTQELAGKAEKVVAIEKDPKMIAILKETLKDFKNVEIIKGDVLKIENYAPGNIFRLDSKYKVVANLPFYLTAPAIRKFLESTKTQPQLMALVVQKEVAQRICSKPPRMNLLAVSVQFYATPEIFSYVSKKSFWPQPEVDGAVLKITPRSQLVGERDFFFKIVKAGFSQPRKQLINNLSKGLKIEREMIKTWLSQNEISPTQRAETLNIGDWIGLVETFPKLDKSTKMC